MTGDSQDKVVCSVHVIGCLNLSLDCLKGENDTFQPKIDSFLFHRGSLKISFRMSWIPENSIYLRGPKGLCSFLCCVKGWEKKILAIYGNCFSHQERKLFQVLIDFFPVNSRQCFCQTTNIVVGIFCSLSSACDSQACQVVSVNI